MAYLLTTLEQLVLVNVIRLVLAMKPAFLREILLVKDGPLAFFGVTAPLRKPMQELMTYLGDKDNGKPLLNLVGLEKSGAFVEHAALHLRKAVAVFSMEMSGAQLAMRMIGSVGRFDQHELRTGTFKEDDWSRLVDAVGRLNDTAIYIDDTAGLNALEVRSRSRRLHRQCDGLSLIVVDYLQLMSSSGREENRATEIAEISRSLKGLAKELKVPVVALSQLNRSVESRQDKRPMMSDLRESGAIEQDADLIVFIYRDEVYNSESPSRGMAEIILAKQRNGPTGKLTLTFLGKYTRFENYAGGERF